MFTDTHVHFDTFTEAGGLKEMIDRALKAGVARMLAVGGSTQANSLALELASVYPEIISASIGYDRDEAATCPDIAALDECLPQDGVCAVGETGLDYHYAPEEKTLQLHLFKQMLALAASYTLPTIIHSREAVADTLKLLDQHLIDWPGAPDRVGVLHCFTGDKEFATELVNRNIYVSFSGIVTFKNAEAIREAAEIVPERLLLIETDAPYLAPVPFRGRENEPAYIVNTAEKMAEIRGCTVEHIASITRTNAARLFGWNDEKEE